MITIYWHLFQLETISWFHKYHICTAHNINEVKEKWCYNSKLFSLFCASYSNTVLRVTKIHIIWIAVESHYLWHLKWNLDTFRSCLSCWLHVHKYFNSFSTFPISMLRRCAHKYSLDEITAYNIILRLYEK